MNIMTLEINEVSITERLWEYGNLDSANSSDIDDGEEISPFEILAKKCGSSLARMIAFYSGQLPAGGRLSANDEDKILEDYIVRMRALHNGGLRPIFSKGPEDYYRSEEQST